MNKNNDWDKKDMFHLQELEDARSKALQLEKTMRWWSECTANWRDKWSKVKNERNIAREEIKRLRLELDYTVKESNVYRRQKKHLEACNEQMRKQLEEIHGTLLEKFGYWDNQHQLLKILEKIELLKQVSVPRSSAAAEEEEKETTDENNTTTTVNSDYTDAEEYVLNDSFAANKEEKEAITPAATLEQLLCGSLFDMNLKIREKDLLKYKLQREPYSIRRGCYCRSGRSEYAFLHEAIDQLESKLSIYKRICKDVEDWWWRCCCRCRCRRRRCCCCCCCCCCEKESLRSHLHANICQDSSTSNSDVDLREETKKEKVEKKAANVKTESCMSCDYRRWELGHTRRRKLFSLQFQKRKLMRKDNSIKVKERCTFLAFQMESISQLKVKCECCLDERSTRQRWWWRRRRRQRLKYGPKKCTHCRPEKNEECSTCLFAQQAPLNNENGKADLLKETSTTWKNDFLDGAFRGVNNFEEKNHHYNDQDGEVAATQELRVHEYIENLKGSLFSIEENANTESNLIRKLQRQMENVETEMAYLQNKLKVYRIWTTQIKSNKKIAATAASAADQISERL